MMIKHIFDSQCGNRGFTWAVIYLRLRKVLVMKKIHTYIYIHIPKFAQGPMTSEKTLYIYIYYIKRLLWCHGALRRLRWNIAQNRRLMMYGELFPWFHVHSGPLTFTVNLVICPLDCISTFQLTSMNKTLDTFYGESHLLYIWSYARKFNSTLLSKNCHSPVIKQFTMQYLTTGIFLTKKQQPKMHRRVANDHLVLKHHTINIHSSDKIHLNVPFL